jgi:hypothetical protein
VIGVGALVWLETNANIEHRISNTEHRSVGALRVAIVVRVDQDEIHECKRLCSQSMVRGPQSGNISHSWPVVTPFQGWVKFAWITQAYAALQPGLLYLALSALNALLVYRTGNDI